MLARSTGGFPLAGHGLGTALSTIGRGALTILCIAAIAAAIVGVRFLVFEYSHGDRQIVLHLLDSLTS